MNIKKKLKFRKYLNKIYFWFTSAFIILLILFSSIAYMNTEKIALDNEYDKSRKILMQINYNIEFMNEYIKNSCTSIYYNVDATSIMNEKNSIFELNKRFLNLDSFLVANKFIKSIYFYDKHDNMFCSSKYGIFQNNDFFNNVKNIYGNTPVLKPVFLKNYGIVKGKQQGDSLFYFMYNNVNGSDLPNSALVVDLDFNWLFENINMLNKLGTNKEDIFFILNGKGDLLLESGQSDDIKQSLKKLFNKYNGSHISQENNLEFYTEKIGSGKYIFSFMNIEKVGIVLVKMGSYKDVFGTISKMKTNVIIITLIFLIVGVIVSVTVSRKIYNPIGNLIKRVDTNQSKNDRFKDIDDEISYLDKVYSQSSDKIAEYEKRMIDNREALKGMYLRKLLYDSAFMSKTDIEAAFMENHINLNLKGGFVICILKIDNVKEFETTYNVHDSALMRFAINNIATEVTSSHFPTEGFDAGSGEIVLVINTGEPSEPGNEYYEKLIELIKEVQENVSHYINLSVSATISDPAKEINELTVRYSSALENSAYRYIFGKGSIITSDMVKDNINEGHAISYDYEKKLEEAIKLGNMNQIEEILKRVFGDIVKLRYSNIMISLFYLIDKVRNIVDEINKVSIEPVYSSFPDIIQRINGMETIEEVYNEILVSIGQITAKREGIELNEKHSLLVASIKDIINNNYYKSSLNSAEIANILKISSGYIGRIFKEYTKMSISEYINEVRLEKAAKLLEFSQHNINEVLMKIGMQNVTYFYSLFKKKYGTTPREYALKKSLDNKI